MIKQSKRTEMSYSKIAEEKYIYIINVLSLSIYTCFIRIPLNQIQKQETNGDLTYEVKEGVYVRK